ncbi:MAG: 4Fe-4S dicluster domain-containing protein [Candidatus Bathyarchaeia archaeon]
MENKKKPIVDMDELSPNFALEIVKAGEENPLNCFQCGECVADCPVSLIEGSYNPRKILRFISLGMRRTVLTSDFIWLCSLCHLCHERCPQGVYVPEIMNTLRNLAVKEGYIHPAFKKLLLIIKEHGRIYEIDDLVNSEREALGLPSLNKETNEIRKIFDKARMSIRQSHGEA